MRAREFICELDGHRGRQRSAPAQEFERAHPGLVAPAGRGDIYIGRYYDFYRISSLAGMDPKDIAAVDEVGFFGNMPVYSAYTEHDREKLKVIMKKLGMKPRDYVSNGSREITDTNPRSPVKPFAGYKK
jgi:hypothetical protein